MKGRAFPAVIWFLTVVLVIALAGGCDSCEPRVDHFRICTLSAPHGSEVTSDRIVMPQGTVRAVKLMPFDTEGKVMEEDTGVWPRVEPSGVLGVSKLQYETDMCLGATDAPWYFVIYGVAPGEATLYLSANGSEGAAIPVTVTPP